VKPESGVLGCITSRVGRDGDMKPKVKVGEGGQQASPRVEVNIQEKECCITESRSCALNQRSGRS